MNFNQLNQGSQIKKLIEKAEDNNLDPFGIKEAKRLLDMAEAKYLDNKQKRWIYCVIGLCLAGPIAYAGSYFIYDLDHAYYDRKQVDHLLG